MFGKLLCWMLRGHKWTRKGRAVVGGVSVNLKRCARCGIVRNVKARAEKAGA